MHTGVPAHKEASTYGLWTCMDARFLDDDVGDGDDDEDGFDDGKLS